MNPDQRITETNEFFTVTYCSGKSSIFADEFSSDRYFIIQDYTCRHHVLRLRASVRPDDNGLLGYLDVVFEGAFFLQMPAHFSGIAISRADDSVFRALQPIYGLSENYARDIFRIQSEGREYYVGAFLLRVYPGGEPGTI